MKRMIAFFKLINAVFININYLYLRINYALYLVLDIKECKK